MNYRKSSKRLNGLINNLPAYIKEGEMDELIE
jgi:hypothetical protein